MGKSGRGGEVNAIEIIRRITRALHEEVHVEGKKGRGDVRTGAASIPILDARGPDEWKPLRRLSALHPFRFRAFRALAAQWKRLKRR